MTDRNALSGTIPTEIGNLSALTGFGLGDNNELTGTIPTEIGNLSVVRSFYLGEWAFISRAKKDSNPVRLPHTFSCSAGFLPIDRKQ
jgi:hypothetical protein